MPVEVVPAEFTYVEYSAAAIAAIAAELMAKLGLADRALRIEVDETTPLGRLRVDAGDPLVIRAESGAFENLRVGRVLSEHDTTVALGRCLLRARDRLDGSFADAPPDDELDNAGTVAWAAYCLGRLERLGVGTNPQRCRYDFRNRHGFTDLADAVFDELWAAEHLTWSELHARSADALAARPQV